MRQQTWSTNAIVSENVAGQLQDQQVTLWLLGGLNVWHHPYQPSATVGSLIFTVVWKFSSSHQPELRIAPQCTHLSLKTWVFHTIVLSAMGTQQPTHPLKNLQSDEHVDAGNVSLKIWFWYRTVCKRVEKHGQKKYNEVGRSFFCGNEVSVSSYSEVRNTNQLCFGAETLLFADISARCLRSKVTLPGFVFFFVLVACHNAQLPNTYLRPIGSAARKKRKITTHAFWFSSCLVPESFGEKSSEWGRSHVRCRVFGVKTVNIPPTKQQCFDYNIFLACCLLIPKK